MYRPVKLIAAPADVRSCGRRGVTMTNSFRPEVMTVSIVVALAAAGAGALAQSGLPNPYRPVKGLADGGGPSIPGGDWAKLPGGREMGPPASVYTDIDGESI